MIRLELALGEIAQHLLGRQPRGAPQGRDVERAREAVGETEEQHGRDPAAGVLEREAALGHLVLLHVAPVEVVDGAWRVHLGRVLAGDVGELGARQDVEIVVGRVTAGVALGADGCAEDDEVFGYAFWGFRRSGLAALAG